MSNRNITQPTIINIIKLSRHFTDYFQSFDKNKWVNGRPILINGNVWCPMCEKWHANNSLCQQS